MLGFRNIAGHFKKDGKLGMTKFSKENTLSIINKLRELLDKIRHSSKVSIVGRSPKREKEKNNEKIVTLNKIIGIETTETLAEAKYRSLTMYAEDFRLRQLGEADFEVKSFGTRVLLDSLFEKKLIDEYLSFSHF